MDEDLVASILDDHESAPIDTRLKAMLGFLRAVSRDPESVTADDVDALHDVGISDEAIEEAVYVCFAFSVMARLADALDFERGDDTYNRRCARFLRRFGYAVSSIP